MLNNVLITGGSGYLGGTLLNRLKDVELAPHKLYALVRTEDQAQAVRQYGAQPLRFNVCDATSVRDHILKYNINVVFSLISAFDSVAQLAFIRALAELRRTSGQDVHFLHTSGAKMFSNHAGGSNRPIRDDDPNLHEMLKSQRALLAKMQEGVDRNSIIVEESERLDVRCYVFLPCMVYGKGEGFGNPISVQTVAVVKAAKALRRVYKIDTSETSWPVCHVVDTAMLYIRLLQRMLAQEDPSFGREGYYLAASGNVAWSSVNSAVAASMYNLGLVDDISVHLADDAVLDRMAVALKSSKELVPPQLSGSCLLEARRGYEIGWKPQYPPEHMIGTLSDEVKLIVNTLGGNDEER